MLRVSNIKLSLDEDKDIIPDKIAKKLKINKNQILSHRIFRQSIDARKKENVHFVYAVDVEVKNEQALLQKNKDKDISKTPDMSYTPAVPGTETLSCPPVIVGTGPAGLFAGLTLAEAGYKPVILERGADVDTRIKIVRHFWNSGELDTECNVQFGEGGAGTFSDGKLTTLIKDKRCRKVLEDFVQAGAPKEILYSYKPHVGTDYLKTVVKNIRKKIISLGGDIRFFSKVTDFIIENNELKGIIINDREKINTQALILAIGHSARDTFKTLYNRNVSLSPKAFSIGVRIEHPQKVIDRAQYGQFAGHKNLGAADYKLAYHSPSGRSAYTFCMCPGGVVISAASEKGCLVTNGMSEYARSEENANSALLVGVTPEDFDSDHPLAGVEFQRKWERKAFEIGGSNYSAPVQLVGDFLQDKPSQSYKRVKPSFTGGYKMTGLKDCLPEYVISTLKEAIIYFDSKLAGFAMPDAVLTGVETRSSSPVRINRNSDYCSNIAGLYPAGEGAGYAGGIVSAAVDGIKVAEQIIKKYRPLA